MTQTKGDITRKALKLAILRIEKGRPKVINKGRKLSIAAVAEESEIGPASIHNNYPEIAEIIRKKTNKSCRTQRDDKQKELKCEKDKTKELRKDIKKLKEDINKLASFNATLLKENQELKAVLASPNVTPMRKPTSS